MGWHSDDNYNSVRICQDILPDRIEEWAYEGLQQDQARLRYVRDGEVAEWLKARPC